jgi:hypothetical protein
MVLRYGLLVLLNGFFYLHTLPRSPFSRRNAMPVQVNLQVPHDNTPTQEFHLGLTHLDSPNSIINSAPDPDAWSWSTLRFRPCLSHINFQPLLSFRPSFVQSRFVMSPSFVRWTSPLETSACFAIARPAALHSALQHVVSNNSTILLQLSRQHL